MLRSYQYTEKSYLDVSVQNNYFRNKEIDIAKEYVNAHPSSKNSKKECPVCHIPSGEYYYTKWGVDYLCCMNCRSIYAVCDDSIAKDYQNLSELITLRVDKTYQNELLKNREEMWGEFIEWAEYRAFRFLRKNKGLNIVDIGNRMEGYSNMIKAAPFCERYDLRDSILCSDSHTINKGEADIVFWFDQLQKELNPSEKISMIRKELKECGLLFVGTRAGSGFDIITLKEKNTNIYPYEHILLVSVKGLTKLLEDNGFEVLEITTPGVMDVKYVKESIEEVGDREGFVRYLLEESSPGILQDFQRFLQKGCLSSFVRVIARRI
ncbi:MAG: class I SAM-dependent methyltransferase [Lachnospiraceae bacterium]|nr:class I SAM-dependent methyltransferase [Lachnospiraceae bacterium]